MKKSSFPNRSPKFICATNSQTHSWLGKIISYKDRTQAGGGGGGGGGGGSTPPPKTFFDVSGSFQ